MGDTIYVLESWATNTVVGVVVWDEGLGEAMLGLTSYVGKQQHFRDPILMAL